MQITLPDDRRIAAKAARAGFDTVDDFVRRLVEDAIANDEPIEPPPSERWRRLERFLDGLESKNPHVDDSRETIYAEREAVISGDDAHPR